MLCQHILITACAGPFQADALYVEVISVGAYSDLSRTEFDACLEFCATGGDALRAYDRWQRLLQHADGLWPLRDPRAAQRIWMNIRTIQDTDTLKVRRREMTVEVTRQPGRKPKIATFSGSKFSTSPQLSACILDMFAQETWPQLPKHTADWLALQRQMSQLPQKGRLLIESFPHEVREHTCINGFAGRNAQQTLGLLLTERLENLGLNPLGSVATDYATLIWGLDALTDAAPLFDTQALRDGLDGWLAGNTMMKRTFRASATIAGLIERNLPTHAKPGGR